LSTRLEAKKEQVLDEANMLLGGAFVPGWATYRHVLFGRETALQGLGIGEGARELRSKKDFQPLTDFPTYRRC
jgi:hypothetical protein